MVDKIDRPEAPAPWRIKEPSKTKDDRPSQQQEESSEKKKEKFEKRTEERWQKYSREVIVKPLKIPLREIKELRYRNVTIRSGITTMECDVIWINGRTTENALITLGGIESYTKAKKLALGAIVPRELWAKSDPIEIGIPQEVSSSGKFTVEELRREDEEIRAKKQKAKYPILVKLGLINKDTGNFQWPVLILYLIVATGLGLAIHAALTMTRTY